MTDTAALLSDPTFNVERMFYYIDAHESEGQLIPTLLSDPSIMLSVAEGPHFRVLERHAHEIDEKVFKKCYEEHNLETWFRKSTSNNTWWGVIIEDDLAIYYRNVNRGEIQTFRGKGSAKMARERWKHLNMCQLGSDDKSHLKTAPGHREIDLIRAATWEALKKFGYSNHYCSNDPTEAQAIFMRSKPLPTSPWNYDTLELVMFAAGPYKVEFKYGGNRDYNHRVHHENKWTEAPANVTLQRDIDRKKKIFKTPEQVAEEALAWLATKCSHFKKVYDNANL